MFVTRTGVSQQRKAALPLERPILDRNSPWYSVTVGAGTHWQSLVPRAPVDVGTKSQKEAAML